MFKSSLKNVLVSVAALMMIAEAGVFLLNNFTKKSDATAVNESVVSKNDEDVKNTDVAVKSNAMDVVKPVVKAESASIAKDAASKKSVDNHIDNKDIKMKQTGNTVRDVKRFESELYKDI